MTNTSTEYLQAPISEVQGIPLEYQLDNGLRRPTPAFIAAFTATTLGTGSYESRYRQLLRDALTIAESMDYETMQGIFTAIGDKAREVECRQCFGTGDIRSTGVFVGTCPTCDGTGLKP